jgi:tRNA threonylcarbamoyladenosine biosynthesis protein TsaE
VAEQGTEIVIVVDTEGDTVALAQALSARLTAGVVIALHGDLGAGKTRFARALGEALGVKDNINSPTFTIIKQYTTGRLPFYHMDVYRLSQEEADELGLDEYFYGEGVTVVEWADLIADLLPEQWLDITIEQTGDTQRVFHIRANGDAYCNLMDGLSKWSKIKG